MPFKKVGPDKYRGPSGRTFNYAQVKRYYSLGGTFTSPSSKSKKSGAKSYSKGGPVTPCNHYSKEM